MRLKKGLRNLTRRVKHVVCPVCGSLVSTRKHTHDWGRITTVCPMCLTHVHSRPNKDLTVTGHTDALSVAMRGK